MQRRMVHMQIHRKCGKRAGLENRIDLCRVRSLLFRLGVQIKPNACSHKTFNKPNKLYTQTLPVLTLWRPKSMSKWYKQHTLELAKTSNDLSQSLQIFSFWICKMKTLSAPLNSWRPKPYGKLKNYMFVSSSQKPEPYPFFPEAFLPLPVPLLYTLINP